MAVQWVRLGGKILVASDRGSWIGQPDLGSASFLTPMPDSLPSRLETTRNLLDGAIAAAERVAPVHPQPPMTASRWAWHLAAQWYSAHHSIALMPAASERFVSDGRDDLAGFARQKLADELGHEKFPLSDLRALGYEGEALVQAVPPDPGVVAGVDYARHTLEGERPGEFLGYMYALERRMMRIPESWLLALERALAPGAQATAGLRLHASALDAHHVEEAVAFFATLTSDDRTSIAIGCHRITRIRCSGLLAPQPSDEQLEGWLSPFRLAGHVAPKITKPRPRGEEA